MKDERKRNYELTDLASVNEPANYIGSLKHIYTEVNANYRYLADIRFRLLSLVPAVSIVAWVELLDKVIPHNLRNAAFGIALSLLAIRIIFGIRMYDKRNDELYNDLISRGRKIEDELGIKTAIFKGRLEANTIDKLFKKPNNHGRSLSIIYSSVLLGWLAFTCWYMYRIIVILVH